MAANHKNNKSKSDNVCDIGEYELTEITDFLKQNNSGQTGDQEKREIKDDRKMWGRMKGGKEETSVAASILVIYSLNVLALFA